MRNRAAIAGIWLVLTCTGIGFAADLPAINSDVPVPVVDQTGIWAAIAYSSAEEKHGFFWGADKRPEAEEIALKYCERAGGKTCVVVTVFRNHRHWKDDDGSGFPYNHCGALAISSQSSGALTPWAASTATTRKNAEDRALQQCEAGAKHCEIREWVCT